MGDGCDFVCGEIDRERKLTTVQQVAWPTKEAYFLRQKLLGHIRNEAVGSNSPWLYGISAGMIWGLGIYFVVILDMHRDMSAVEYLAYVGSIAGALWLGGKVGEDAAYRKILARYHRYVELELD